MPYVLWNVQWMELKTLVYGKFNNNELVTASNSGSPVFSIELTGLDWLDRVVANSGSIGTIWNTSTLG